MLVVSSRCGDGGSGSSSGSSSSSRCGDGGSGSSSGSNIKNNRWDPKGRVVGGRRTRSHGQ